MATGDDADKRPGFYFEDDENDATMELSLKDVFAMSRQDRRAVPEDPTAQNLASLARAAEKLVFDEPDFLAPEDETISVEPLSLEELSLEEDTNPAGLDENTNPSISMSVPPEAIPPHLMPPAADDAETFTSVDGVEGWADSTSVFQPDEDLLQAARRGFQDYIQSSPEEVHNEWGGDGSDDDSSTGLFEIPAALLMQLKTEEEEEEELTSSPPSAPGRFGNDSETVNAPLWQPGDTFEVSASVDERGRLILDSQEISSLLSQGMRLKLSVEVID